MASARFRTFAWGVLAFVVLVILWGALVRATGSGAGCGSHWPSCNGVVVPPSPTAATVIEYTHRVTSGLSALLVLAEVVWAFRLYERGNHVRRVATWAGVFMGLEVLIGAGIVLLRYVGDNPSLARAGWMAVHLVNTFLLVATLTLTAWWSDGRRAASLRGQGAVGGMVGAALGLVLFAAMTGAIAALGDTLFPAGSLAEGLQRDLSPAAHVLERLRVLHPVAAVVAALVALYLPDHVAARRDAPELARAGLRLRGAVVAQIVFGFANFVMLAPTWMQLVHLLLAQVVWVTLLLFGVEALAAPPVDDAVEQPAGA